MDKIRTLGLYQPYAHLMLHGKIETRWIRRGRRIPFPNGKYLLYATKKEYTLQQLSQIAGSQYTRITEKINGVDLVRGAAIAVGDLVKKIYILPGMENETFVDCRETTRIKFIAARVAGSLIPIKVSQVMVGLIFENVRPIKPFPFKGKQGIGFMTEEDKAKIEYL